MLRPPATSISRRVMPSHNFFGEPRTVNIAKFLARWDIAAIGKREELLYPTRYGGARASEK